MLRICPCSIKLMKTSSKPDATLPPLVWLDDGTARWRARARPRRRRSRAANCRRRPPAARREFRAAVRPVAPDRDHGPTTSSGRRCAITSSTVPCGEQFALGNVSEPVAAFGFIHVVRGDEEGQPLGGELMNLLPEIAARFRIDARRRLVEQQQFRADE